MAEKKQFFCDSCDDAFTPMSDEKMCRRCRRQAATEAILQRTYFHRPHDPYLKDLFDELEATGWGPEEAKKG